MDGADAGTRRRARRTGDAQVSGAVIPVLWLCGPPGVGKTTVGWEIYSQLTLAGIAAGYVDIDQLGICHPDPPADPDRHRVKARNLGAVVAGFRAAGARCVVVSGVVDPDRGVPVDLIPDVALTVCRLRVDRDELRERFVGRGAMLDQLAAVLREADTLDRSDFADVCVDTSGLPVAEVVRQVRAQAGPAYSDRPSRNAPTWPPRDAAPGPILWLCGTTGVGKSSVGWQVYQRAQQAGRRAAFVDLDQVGFLRPPPADDPANHRLKAHNLAAIWQAYHDEGVECLVVVGQVDDSEAVKIYTEALPEAALTLCRLHAGRDQLLQRVMARGQGDGPNIPGDQLKGQPEAALHRAAAAASARADALEHAAIGDLRIDTDGRTLDDLAAAITTQAPGWPTPE